METKDIEDMMNEANSIMKVASESTETFRLKAKISRMMYKALLDEDFTAEQALEITASIAGNNG